MLERGEEKKKWRISKFKKSLKAGRIKNKMTQGGWEKKLRIQAYRTIKVATGEKTFGGVTKKKKSGSGEKNKGLKMGSAS